MTDRRNRPIIRCAEPSCVSVGHWQASRGYCPAHYREFVAYLRAAIQRVRDRPDPDPYRVASAALSGNPPERNTQ